MGMSSRFIRGCSGVRRKIFRGFQVMAGLVGGRDGAPQDSGEFSKFGKKILRKITKNALFKPNFQENFKIPGLHFRAFGRKSQSGGEVLRKF